MACLFLAVVLNDMCYQGKVYNEWSSAGNETECVTVASDHGDNHYCVNCIDVYQFHFMFPPDVRKEDMWFCGSKELKELCALR